MAGPSNFSGGLVESAREQPVALSLRQPWAALLVHGYKSVEIRSWRTARRGRVLIHAARTPDPRRQAWSRVPAELNEAAGLFGGIVGAVDLVDCVTYHNPEAFAADQDRHLNEPTWFRGLVLYGLVFSGGAPLAFQPHPGRVRFFRISEPRESVEPWLSFW